MKSSQVLPASSGAEVQPRPVSEYVRSSRLPRIAAPSLAVQGKYSVERLLELEEYCRTKSHWHILGVVIWTPLVPVLMILVYQLPPLAPPEAGLRANWMYLIERGGLGAYTVHEAWLVIARATIPELEAALPLRTRVVLGGIFAGVYTVVTAALASWWGFPVPFTASIANPTCGVTGIACLYLVVRPILNQSTQLQRRFMVIIVYATVFMCASLGYPAYIALFVFVGGHSPTYQPFVTLLALFIKLVLRKIVAYAFRECEDLVPVMVIFSVEFFSSLYQVVSLQTSSSFVTTAFIIAFDFASTARRQWELYKSTESLQSLLRDTEADALLPVVADLCEAHKTCRGSSGHVFQQLCTIHVLSTLRHSLPSTEKQQRLESTNVAQVVMPATWKDVSPEVLPRPPSPRQGPILHTSFKRACMCRSSSKVAAPAISRLPASRRSRKIRANIIAQQEQSTAIVEASTTLFRTEIMLLTEYLECVIPFFYAVNIVITWLSPNAQYYPLAATIKTLDELVLVLVNIAVLAAVEVASFVLLNWMLRKRLRFSPMHQIGFVTETHAPIIRANMLFVLVMILHLNVVHTGVDFTFQFKWLHSDNSNSTSV